MSGDNRSDMEVDTLPDTPPNEVKSFHERLSEIPMYSMTLSQLTSAYTSLKDRNQVLNQAFTTGEKYFTQASEVAKPVVLSATETALKAAKPIVGDITDPAGKIDQCASEALAKVQEKLPIVNQTPTQIAESAKASASETANYYKTSAQETANYYKTSAKETANYYIEKLSASRIGQQTTTQLDNAVSFSELMVEICFPTDGSCPDDLKELEQAEEDEDKGLLVRAGNLKERAVRRGTRKVMSYTPVQTTIDNVQYAQKQISEMTQKVLQGTNYVATKSLEAKDLLKENYPTIKTLAQETLVEGTELIGKKWDHVYKTSMYIPKKAIQVTGEVYINAQEIVFAYSKAHSLTELPHAVVEMAEKYYNNLATEGMTMDQVKEKAVAFVYVPAQVISEYLRTSRLVQWIVPKSIQTERIEMVEVSRSSSPVQPEGSTNGTSDTSPVHTAQTNEKELIE